MKKVVALVVVFAMVFAMVISLTGCGDTEKFYVYNWGDYIDEGMEEEFEAYYREKTGKTIDMVYSTFDTNEVMLTQVTKGDSKVDVACPSEYTIQKLLKKDLIQKIDKAAIENYNNIDKDILNKVDATFGEISGSKMSDYYVPYMWGTLGILYNPEIVSTEQAEDMGWGLLWNTAKIPELNGKILMKDSYRDAFVATELFLKEQNKLPAGYENKSIAELINCTDSVLFKAVEDALKEQKDVRSGFEVDTGKDDMINGAAYVNLAWSGDAMYAIEEADAAGVELAYFVPEVGGNIWFDGWVVMKDSEKKDVAEVFMSFLCEPKIAIRNSIYIGYTSGADADILKANTDVTAILEDNEYDVEEFFSDTNRYPDSTSDTLAVMTDFGDKSEDAVNMWLRITGETSGLSVWAVVGIVVAAIAFAAGVVVLVIFIKKKKGSVRRVN